MLRAGFDSRSVLRALTVAGTVAALALVAVFLWDVGSGENGKAAVPQGHISYGLAGLGYTSENMARPRFLRMKQRPTVVVDVGMFDGEDYTIPGLESGHRVFAFEVGDGKIDAIKEWAAKAKVPVGYVRPTLKDEPVPGMPDRRPAAERPQLYLVHAAVSSVRGNATFVVTGKRSTVDTLAVDPKFRPCGDGQCVEETVPVVRLDDIVDEDVWILKSDTQGFDCHVLLGAEKLLRRRVVQYITFEFAPKVMDSTGCSALTLLRFMEDVGYQCFEWAPVPNDFDHNIRTKSFEDYLADFEETHTYTFVGFKWTELMCIHRTLL